MAPQTPTTGSLKRLTWLNIKVILKAGIYYSKGCLLEVSAGAAKKSSTQAPSPCLCRNCKGSSFFLPTHLQTFVLCDCSGNPIWVLESRVLTGCWSHTCLLTGCGEDPKPGTRRTASLFMLTSNVQACFSWLTTSGIWTHITQELLDLPVVSFSVRTSSSCLWRYAGTEWNYLLC